MQGNGEIDISMSTMPDNTAQGRGNALHIVNPNFVKITTSNFSPFDGASTVYLAGGAAAGCSENPCDPGSSCSYAAYSLICTPCPANTYSPDGLVCGLCAAGTGPNAAQTTLALVTRSAGSASARILRRISPCSVAWTRTTTASLASMTCSTCWPPTLAPAKLLSAVLVLVVPPLYMYSPMGQLQYLTFIHSVTHPRSPLPYLSQ